MIVGHRLSDATVYKDIKLIPPGARAILAEGKCMLVERERPAWPHSADLVRDGRNAITSAISRCLEADPHCAMELSGGLDSRMVLAATPKDSRTGRTAYTIGYPDSPDISVARSLAKATGMHHYIVDLTQFNDETTDTVWQRARRVAYRDDFSTNVFDRLTIDCVDDILLGIPRIGGVNGELARGFYYPTLPVTKPLTQDIAQRLLSWRLTTNDAAPMELFDKDVLFDCRASLKSAVEKALREAELPQLGDRLDYLYLRQRMRHWSGSALTRAMSHRTIFAPFFHSGYVAWAMGLPVQAKKDSMAFCRVLESLDSDLATAPLDSGLLPRTIAKGGISMHLALMQTKQKKILDKILQRFAGKRRINLGGAHFQSRLSRTEIREKINWDGIQSIGIFDTSALHRLKYGGINWNRSSISHIINLNFLNDYLNYKSNPNITKIT
jgi:asparagine synthase (glutamine-hydrolysing)